jgi:hypothetical protein
MRLNHNDHVQTLLLDDIISLIQRSRPCIKLNPGFVIQLRQYESNTIST